MLKNLLSVASATKKQIIHYSEQYQMCPFNTYILTTNHSISRSEHSTIELGGDVDFLINMVDHPVDKNGPFALYEPESLSQPPLVIKTGSLILVKMGHVITHIGIISESNVFPDGSMSHVQADVFRLEKHLIHSTQQKILSSYLVSHEYGAETLGDVITVLTKKEAATLRHLLLKNGGIPQIMLNIFWSQAELDYMSDLNIEKDRFINEATKVIRVLAIERGDPSYQRPYAD
jgi:hypothetical protein